MGLIAAILEHTCIHTYIHTEICALYIRLAAPRRRPRPFGALLLLRSSYSPCGADCPFGAIYTFFWSICFSVCVCYHRYVYVRRNKLFSVLDVSLHYIVLVKFFRFIYFILSFVASSLHLMVCAAALQQVQPLRGCCIVPSQVKTLKITASSRYFLECLHFSFGAICQHPFRTLLWLQ